MIPSSLTNPGAGTPLAVKGAVLSVHLDPCQPEGCRLLDASDMAPTKIAVSSENFALGKCDNFIDNDRICRYWYISNLLLAITDPPKGLSFFLGVYTIIKFWSEIPLAR